MTPEDPLTAELNRWAEGGGAEALNDLFPKIYDELRSLARAHLRKSFGSGVTLQPTVLVNEAYIRLSKHSATPFTGRQEFFALASKMIRHILVDHLRQRRSHKRGGEVEIASLEGAFGESGVSVAATGVAPLDLLALDQALKRLETRHPAQAQVIECRFFGGLTHPEIAKALSLSLATVERHWSVGKRRLATLIGPAQNL